MSDEDKDRIIGIFSKEPLDLKPGEHKSYEAFDQSCTQPEENRDAKAASVHMDLRMGMSCSSNDMLDRAKGLLVGSIILGYDINGNEYLDCNIDDGGMAIWLLQRAIYILMAGTK